MGGIPGRFLASFGLTMAFAIAGIVPGPLTADRLLVHRWIWLQLHPNLFPDTLLAPKEAMGDGQRHCLCGSETAARCGWTSPRCGPSLRRVH